MNIEYGALRNLSANDWRAFGVDTLAYVKPVLHQGQTVYAIHAADGTQLTIVPDREVALAAMLQHDLEPSSVH